jgi:hypothetical protein
MQVMHASSHKVTEESANFLMLGREIRLPALLTHDINNDEQHFVSTYAQELVYRMEKAHALLRDKQSEIRLQDSDEPNQFKNGDYVWLRSIKITKLKLVNSTQSLWDPT